MDIKNKRILVTAGPTWVPIDAVRMITNTASAQTGILVAEKLARAGAKVTLLLGPVGYCPTPKNVTTYRFNFFNELFILLYDEIMTKKYHVVIHSAAVSDYRPRNVFQGKVSSQKKNWHIDLVPTSKIIDYIKKWDPGLFLVGFKYEPESTREALLRDAYALMRRTAADAVIANTRISEQYRAYLATPERASGPFITRAKVVQQIIALLKRGISL